jgi:hypothetical protein
MRASVPLNPSMPRAVAWRSEPRTEEPTREKSKSQRVAIGQEIRDASRPGHPSRRGLEGRLVAATLGTKPSKQRRGFMRIQKTRRFAENLLTTGLWA